MITLDAQQKEAVVTSSTRALILAGAGSGKTRVLVERIAHLIENEHVSPYEILAFTFTRKAAGEMKNRLLERIGTQAHHITMGTMHSIALQLIKRFGEFLGMKPKNVTVYGEWESQYMLREVAFDLGYYDGKKWKVPKKHINAMFADYYERGIEPDEFSDPGYALFREFIGRCAENNAVTYGSLLIGMKFLLPLITEYLQWKYVLVDEVQDIDTLQWQIIEHVTNALGASLFIVGDIDQSIFEWRGAIPEYLIDHSSTFDIYRLETNYRSRPDIVAATNQLIRHNTHRLDKTMMARREQDDKGVFEFGGMDSTALAEYLRMLADGGAQLKDFAVLARTHVLLEKLSMLLTEKGVNHVRVGEKAKLTNSEEFRRFHAFLKLIVNPYDNFSFLLIRDLIGLSREEYNLIRKWAVDAGESHFQAWERSEGEWQTRFKEMDIPLNDVIDVLFEGLRDDIFLPSMNFIAQWMESAAGTISDYLDWLATYDVQDEIAESAEQLQLMSMTIHAAKGLEWKTVILAGCNEGIIPSKQSLNNGGVEAERRLMYVAMTRAEDTLIMAVRPEVTESVGKDGKVRIYENPASRFLREAL